MQGERQLDLNLRLRKKNPTLPAQFLLGAGANSIVDGEGTLEDRTFVRTDASGREPVEREIQEEP